LIPVSSDKYFPFKGVRKYFKGMEEFSP